ncbi:response regulator transcription factor [Tomitella fengzijianii]|uniref:Response regulator transcription factor n=1 Tax=Tomitella fengzijianii TaxID=2597660 RepID=A0A516X4Z8_9ACTN|nr:response regulator transcription factor [Tomitella fengzijianii]QDQ98152.1 response regulator transcription factor [Tomitella fengzijianii]
MRHILIAEDEARISSFLAKGLRAAGYTTECVADGRQAWEHASSGQYDLMILDLGLPVQDGMWVLRRLRAGGNRLPVVILTAHGTVADTVSGLQSGADDYLRKPFAFDELLARVELRLRGAGASPEPTVLHAGPVALDLQTRRARVEGRAVELTSREFALAEAFMRHPDQVLSRQQLLSQVWGLDFDPGSNVIDVYVRYLRRKIGDDRIETVRGAGYRMAAR